MQTETGSLSAAFSSGKSWGSFTSALNNGKAPWCKDDCAALIAGPKPVDADTDGALLKAAIADHAGNWDVYACSRTVIARDDKVCASNRSLADVSELADREAIQKSGIPIMSFVGYFDGNSPQLALARYRTFTNPQVLVMGAMSHGGEMSTDPFQKRDKADPTSSEQTARMADFFDRYLKGAPASALLREKGGGVSVFLADP